MKIDESCINHNAVKLIHEITSSIYESDSEYDKDMMLGEIAGIIDLANELKEVLET